VEVADVDPSQATTEEALCECLVQLRRLAGGPTYRELERLTATRGGLLPGTGLSRVSLRRTALSDVFTGKMFPRKAFLLTLVETLGVDLATDRRWERAWNQITLAAGPDQPGVVEQLHRRIAELSAEVDEWRERANAVPAPEPVLVPAPEPEPAPAPEPAPEDVGPRARRGALALAGVLAGLLLGGAVYITSLVDTRGTDPPTTAPSATPSSHEPSPGPTGVAPRPPTPNPTPTSCATIRPRPANQPTVVQPAALAPPQSLVCIPGTNPCCPNRR
jgi:hypothetical protein